MAGPALYEMLTGHYANGMLIDDLHANNQLAKSVLDNIQRILNSRQGALKHIPDYGIPDLSVIYKNLPASAHHLKQEIRDTLLKYEPRLAHLDVELINPKDNVMILCYQLNCAIRHLGVVRVDTYFLPEGVVDLKQIL